MPEKKILDTQEHFFSQSYAPIKENYDKKISDFNYSICLPYTTCIIIAGGMVSPMSLVLRLHGTRVLNSARLNCTLNPSEADKLSSTRFNFRDPIGSTVY